MDTTKQLIYQQIPKAMRAIESIAKKRENAQQGYSFRGIDDVYNELHDILAEYEIFTVPEVISEEYKERTTQKGNVLIYRILKIKYTFYTHDGSSVSATVIGEGMDTGDKAANKAMAVAHKYALLQIFCIPTDDPKDPENESPVVGGDFKSTVMGQDPFMSTVNSPREQTGEVKKSQFPTVQIKLSDGKMKDVDKYGALDYFKKLKGVLGELSYYAILKQHGFEKSDQIPLEKIPEIYSQMIASFELGKAKQESQGEEEETPF